MSSQSAMTCQEALRFLAAYLDNELSGGEHQSVQQHLEACRSCYSRAEFERRLKLEIRKLSQDDVSTGFEERVPDHHLPFEERVRVRLGQVAVVARRFFGRLRGVGIRDADDQRLAAF